MVEAISHCHAPASRTTSNDKQTERTFLQSIRMLQWAFHIELYDIQFRKYRPMMLDDKTHCQHRTDFKIVTLKKSPLLKLSPRPMPVIISIYANFARGVSW